MSSAARRTFVILGVLLLLVCLTLVVAMVVDLFVFDGAEQLISERSS